VLAERHGRATWSPPAPYGYAETVQSAGMVVAPLLAGFTITLIGLLLGSARSGVRYPDTALTVLVAAVAILLAAVQCAYAARQYVVTPAEIGAWWPGVDDPDDRGELGQWWELRAEQLAHRKLHSLWASRFRLTYHGGIMLVLLGLAIVLVPPEQMNDISPMPWVAVVLAGLAVVGEGTWVVATGRSKTPDRAAAVHERALEWLSPAYVPELRAAREAMKQRRAKWEEAPRDDPS
jgi:hypothetical protein